MDNKHWLIESFLPMMAYRLHKDGIFLDESEQFILQNRILLWKSNSMFTSIDGNLWYSLCVGYGPKDDPLAAFYMTSIAEAGKDYVEDVSFYASKTSSKWAKFNYDFYAETKKKARNMCAHMCPIIRLDIIEDAARYIRNKIEQRPPNAMVQVGRLATILDARETVEEVLVERDLKPFNEV